MNKKLLPKTPMVFLDGLRQKLLSYKSPALAGLFSLCLIALSWQRPQVNSSNEKIKPIKEMQHFTFGYRETLADSAWLRLIQDIDYCEKKIEGKNVCRSGWVYSMLDYISDLAPTFRMPLAVGPLVLAVVVDDTEGATKLYEKAVRLFPHHWPILYRAAYHAMAEEKNIPKAARLMELAAKEGAPPWVYNLATQLYSKAGQNELALRLYEEMKGSDLLSEELKERMRKRLGIH
jgi:hypothetical protein